jgi:hypothetical protein
MMGSGGVHSKRRGYQHGISSTLLQVSAGSMFPAGGSETHPTPPEQGYGRKDDIRVSGNLVPL